MLSLGLGTPSLTFQSLELLNAEQLFVRLALFEVAYIPSISPATHCDLPRSF